MKKILLFILILSVAVYAGTDLPKPINISIKDMFTPATGDISIKVLQKIFGGTNHMISALSGSENELIKKIFLTLNSGGLFLASIVLTYTITTSVLRTSQDGGMSQMGKITPMSIFRIVSGLTLMTPIPTIGFSTIQLSVLWAAVHGIGFADTIFTYVADNFVKTTQVVNSDNNIYDMTVKVQRVSLKNNSASKQSQFISNEQDSIYQYGDDVSQSLLYNANLILDKAKTQINNSGNKKSQEIIKFIDSRGDLFANGAVVGKSVNFSELLASSVCLAVIDDYYTGKDSQCREDCDKQFAVRSQDCSSDGSINLCFGYKNNPNLCGGYKVNGYNLSLLQANSQFNTKFFKSEFIPKFKQQRLSDLKQLHAMDPEDKDAIASFEKEAKNNNIVCKQSGCEIANNIASIATAIINSVPDDSNSTNNAKNTGVAKQGWLAAGYNIGNLSSGFSSKTKSVLPEASVLDQVIGRLYIQLNSISSQAKSSKKFHPESQFFDTKIDIAQRYIEGMFFGFVNTMLGINSSVVVPACSNPPYSNCYSSAVASKYIVMPNDPISVTSPRTGILGSIASFSENPFAQNPIKAAQITGISLLEATYNLWVTFPKYLLQDSATVMKKYRSLIMTVGSVSVAVQSLLEFIPPAGIKPIGHIAAVTLDTAVDAFLIVPQLFYQFDITTLFLYVPVVGAISLAIFSVAFLLAVWVPILPMLIFLLAVFGWFFSLIEAMVAAPLIAVGITHPEGHDFLGQAQQSLMLMLIVFLRPVLLLFGLITSVIFFYFSAYILNIGFITTLLSLLGNNALMDGGLYSALTIFCFFLLYGYLLSSMAGMTYSNIYRIPERIALWIGGQPEQSIIAQMLDKTKGQLSQSVSQAGSGGSSSSSDDMLKAKTTSVGGQGYGHNTHIADNRNEKKHQAK